MVARDERVHGSQSEDEVGDVRWRSSVWSDARRPRRYSPRSDGPHVHGRVWPTITSVRGRTGKVRTRGGRVPADGLLQSAPEGGLWAHTRHPRTRATALGAGEEGEPQVRGISQRGGRLFGVRRGAIAHGQPANANRCSWLSRDTRLTTYQPKPARLRPRRRDPLPCVQRHDQLSAAPREGHASGGTRSQARGFLAVTPPIRRPAAGGSPAGLPARRTTRPLAARADAAGRRGAARRGGARGRAVREGR